ncbi:MAG: hypothetical protein ACKV2V_09890 [Blastocatellia bacterium]
MAPGGDATDDQSLSQVNYSAFQIRPEFQKTDHRGNRVGAKARHRRFGCIHWLNDGILEKGGLTPAFRKKE